MRRREDIRSEIKCLDDKIEEYNGKIYKLEEHYKIIKMNYDKIVRDVYEPEKACDLTPFRMCGEEEYRQAEVYRKRVIDELDKSLGDTLRFLSSIQDAIKNISGLIKECEIKKRALEAELDNFLPVK